MIAIAHVFVTVLFFIVQQEKWMDGWIHIDISKSRHKYLD